MKVCYLLLCFYVLCRLPKICTTSSLKWASRPSNCPAMECASSLTPSTPSQVRNVSLVDVLLTRNYMYMYMEVNTNLLYVYMHVHVVQNAMHFKLADHA